MAANFAEPYPRSAPKVYLVHQWPLGEVTRLDQAPVQLSIDLLQVLRSRQTRRVFRHLPLDALGTLLWLTCRTHSSQTSPFGFDQHFRPHPSAGAIHPIQIICQRGPGMPWERYEPLEHVLVSVPGTEILAQDARTHVAQAVPADNAVLIGIVAEAGKTAAKYHAEQSLVWRDAGVVIGYLSLVAEMLKMSFCPVGMTGNAFIAPLSERGQLQGVGLALLGADLENSKLA